MQEPEARAPGIELRKKSKVDYRQLAGLGATKTSRPTDIEPQNVNETLPKSLPLDTSAVDPHTWDPRQSIESLEKELQDLELQENILTLKSDIEQRKQRICMLGQTQSSARSEQPLGASHHTFPDQNGAANRQLEAALEVLKKVQLEDLLDSNGLCEPPPTAGMSIRAKQDPILFVTDFVVFQDKNTRDREQSLGRGLFFKDKLKVKLEDVSVAQWASATARILIKLLPVMDKLRLTSTWNLSARCQTSCRTVSLTQYCWVSGFLGSKRFERALCVSYSLSQLVTRYQ